MTASFFATKAALLALLLAAALPATAAIEPVPFTEPENIERYERLVTTLRCLVCQNQSLADSNAPLARDMREIIVEQIQADASDEQILAFMTERYGDFVLLKPRFTYLNAALWLGPLAVLVLALIAVPRLLKAPSQGSLNPEEKEKVRNMLEEDSP